MKFKIELDERQMQFAEVLLDNLLRSEGLKALAAVVDFSNVLKSATKEESQQKAQPTLETPSPYVVNP